ncbi:MAG: D-alanyl-D-alanine carboxypeptidase [Tindallia sp. MSAO_Bac2]|nr:MAG: D-alanyl-D-alanine carboxypeptidase [Tindallia sp. MSAO_Bac2]
MKSHHPLNCLLSRIILISILVLLIAVQIFPAVFASEHPDISAPRAILMDKVTGEIIYEKNAHDPTYPASTTKVLTAIVVLENADLQEMVHIDYEPGVTGSSMFILPGESFTVETLLQALLIRSGNDVAEVLARHISGSVESFVELMNEKAVEIGAKNTHFTNPHGLPDEDHITTAYDLAVIARYAMQDPVFREIVAAPSLIIPETLKTPEQRIYNNSNRFLWGRGPSHQMFYNEEYTNIFNPRVDGIKTGFTNAAQHCLISSASDEKRQVITVVLNAEREHLYPDSRTLLDYGLDEFQLVTLTDEKMLATSVPINNGTRDNLSLFTEKAIHTIIPAHVSADDISQVITVDDSYEAPIESNQILGKVVYNYDNQILGETNLIAMESVEFLPFYRRIPVFGFLIASILMIFAIWQVHIFRLRKKKRRMYLRKRMERYE